MRHDLTKAVDLAHLLGCGFAQGVHAAEMLTKQCGGFIADVADAQAEQQFVEVIPLGAFDRGEQILGALFLEFVKSQKVLFGQGVQVGHRMHKALIGKLDRDRFA